MLIIPLQRKLSLTTFPWVTFLIFLVNVFVFFGLQASDQAQYARATQHYFNKGLHKVELPLYLEHLEQHDESERHEQLAPWVERALGDDDDESSSWFGDQSIDGHDFRTGVVRSLQADEAFQQSLANASASTLNLSPQKQRLWQDDRKAFEAKFSRVFTERFHLSFQEPKAVQWFTSMFMHGGFGHLFGNMVFLFLLGLMVEGALKPHVYFGAYVLTGLAAGAASVLVHAGEGSGLVGASGAIAGLMGMYCTLFGMRPVRFFYWVVFYFDYVRKPALYLLPAWLGWELYQFFTSDTNVAYEAHAGGIACGAFLGWLMHRLGWAKLDYLDETSQAEDQHSRAQRLDQVQALLAKLEVAPAKQLLQGVLDEAPHDLTVASLWFNACALKKNDPDIHDAAKRLFAFRGMNFDTDRTLVEAFQRYRTVTDGKVKLNASALLSLSQRMVRQEQLDDAAKLLGLLKKSAPNTPGLSAAIEMWRMKKHG